MVKLGLAVDLAFRIEQAVAFDGAIALRASGAAVEVMTRALGADEDEHDEIHEDGFARAGDAREDEVALHGEGVLVAIPVDGVDAGEADGAGHGGEVGSGKWEVGSGKSEV